MHLTSKYLEQIYLQACRPFQGLFLKGVMSRFVLLQKVNLILETWSIFHVQTLLAFVSSV